MQSQIMDSKPNLSPSLIHNFHTGSRCTMFIEILNGINYKEIIGYIRIIIE